MAAAPVFSLSTLGLIDNVSLKADRITAYFFVSDFSQTTLMVGKVTSLAAIIQKYGSDELSLRSTLETQLQALYGRYFDTATVNVSTDKPNPADPNRINLTVDVLVTENNVQYSLGREIQIQNGTVLKIIDLNNNG